MRNLKGKKYRDSYSKEDAFKILEHNIIWINSADNKAAILIAFLGFLVTFIVSIMSLKLSIEFAEDKIILIIITTSMVITILITTILLIINIIQVLTARTVKYTSKKKNLYYFNDIVQFSFNDYLLNIKSKNNKELLDDLLQQVYETSKIANIKFYYLNKSYKNFAILFSAFIILLFTLFFY